MSNFDQLSDEQLVEIVRNKDKQLYAEIIRRFEKKLLRYANYLVGDEALATDAVQEAFIKAYVNLHSFNLKLKFSSWLYRIVHNQAINLAHKNKQHLSTETALEIASDINLEDELIKKELQEHLHECIEKMPLLYKEPLVLFFLEEKSYQEISDILRLPTGSVGTRINRAKHSIRQICQKTN